MHHPEGGPGGDAVARRRVRLPQAQGRHARRASSTRLGADRARSWMIGDCASDVQAGARRGPARRASCSRPTAASSAPSVAVRSALVPDAHGATLAELAGAILRPSRRRAVAGAGSSRRSAPVLFRRDARETLHGAFHRQLGPQGDQGPLRLGRPLRASRRTRSSSPRRRPTPTSASASARSSR